MSFFASRKNAIDADFELIEQAMPAPAVAQPPAVVDTMLRKFTGLGFADLQGAANQAGDMLASYKGSLERIEAALVVIADRLDRIEARKK